MSLLTFRGYNCIFYFKLGVMALSNNKLKENNRVCVALDGTGGDHRDTYHVVEAVRFALAMYPALYLIIFGSAQLEQDLGKASLNKNRYEFRLAQQQIPQDEPPRQVLKNYPHAAMVKMLECIRTGEAQAALSGGGTGPMVALARHMLGVQRVSEHKIKLRSQLNLSERDGMVRPGFAARIPVGSNRFALMLDLGANASCTAADLYDFALLGNSCAQELLGIDSPRIALLNIGTELGKGNKLVHQAKELMEADRSLQFTGFIEANRIFRDEADVIVTDGFTGNIALKAAEGVAELFGSSGGMKRFFAKMARPDWLLPWQYNGSVLLGVNGIVVKSHASAGKEAMAVAMVEAARAAQARLADSMREHLLKLR